MNTPPLLLGAALLFWGLQSGLFIPAAIMALLLESSRVLSGRMNFSRTNFHRISDLCALLIAAAAVHAFFVKGMGSAFSTVTQRIPLLLFPLVAVQAFSVQQGVDVSTFFWSFRKRQQESGPRKFMDFGYIYFAICVLSAGTANVRTPTFYAGLFLLSAWALWRVRPARTSVAAWGAGLLLAGFLGFRGHVALHELQGVVEQAAVDAAFGLVGVRKNPFKSSTAIGSIGKLKRFNTILLRLKTPGGKRPPVLLRNATYNMYGRGLWFSGKADFEDVSRGARETMWELAPSQKKLERVRISGRLPRGKGVLALPHGAFRVEGLLASEMGANRLGTLKVEGAPRLAVYNVAFGPDEARDAAPDKIDLVVPSRQKAVMSKVAGELGLASMRRYSAMEALNRFFQKDFRYSVYEKDRGKGGEPLSNFLLKSKAGHCEYFATSSVLILRSAGIPARYATGYAVIEFSGLEDEYVIRQRHAHAWVRVHDGKKWVDLDTTPASWDDIEKERVSGWQPIRDVVSWAKFRFSRWQWTRREEGQGRRFFWLLLPIIVFAAWKLLSGLRKARLQKVREKAALPVWPGKDSEFYKIEKILQKEGCGRRSWESPSGWLTRIEKSARVGGLRPLLELHYRHRFDPAGINAKEREALRADVDRWIKKRSGV